MALIEAEEELFGLRDTQESVHLNEISGSEEEYDDDDAGENAAGQQPPGEQGDVQDAASDPNAAKIVKPKRVIKNPQPKLDVARLCGPRGIGIIQKFLSDAPYRGKGHETEDLGLLLKKLQHWAHRLYPKLPFLDTILHIEKLGNKKPLQVNLKRLRLDMYETPKEGAVDGEVVDDVQRLGGGESDASPDDEQPDVFDELLRQSGVGLNERLTVGGPTNSSSDAAPPSLPPSQPVVLTDEQKARIERNKQLALARRQAMMASTDGSNTSTPSASAPVISQDQQRIISNKRSREEDVDGAESDDDSIQPTPTELRTLREGLLSGVISSQDNAVSAKGDDSVAKENDAIESSSSGSNKQHDFQDDFEEMDVDDVLDALNKAEDKTVDDAPALSLPRDNEGPLKEAILNDSPHKSLRNTDDLSDGQSSTDLPELAPSLPVVGQLEPDSEVDEPTKFVDKDGNGTIAEEAKITEDLNSAVTGHVEPVEQPVLDAEGVERSVRDATNSPILRDRETDSLEMVVINDKDNDLEEVNTDYRSDEEGTTDSVRESADADREQSNEINCDDAINCPEKEDPQSECLETEPSDISR